MKKSIRFIILIFCIAAMFIGQASAMVPYSTYTYDINGNPVESPHAYVPDKVIDSNYIGLTTSLSEPTDLFVTEEEEVYIADAKNNRIIVLDKDFKFKYCYDNFINDQGVPDNLELPSGVFIKGDELFVADTNNNRIVVFDKETHDFKRIIGAPESDVFPEGHVYKPIALSVDNAGRIYVISSTTHYGVISMNADGVFLGFLGAQKTAPTAFQIFSRMFQNKEQREQLIKLVPTEYNNITIDSSGFIYVTTNSIDKAKQASAMKNKSRSGDYAPVKRLNPQGNDVMLRTGFYPPSGDVSGSSSIIDVALGDYGMWSIVDSATQKIFTYDDEGNLLFIFGSKGSLVGNTQNITAIAYKGTDFLALDKTNNTISIFKRTEYGDCISLALQNTKERNYDQSAQYWREILLRNSNFDQAYIGIGDSLYRSGKYEEAMESYSYAFATGKYSDSYAQIRKAWIEKYVLVIPVVIVAICFGLSKFFKYANKVNKAGQVMKDKRTLKEAVLYGFHVIFHPFDGFWDLKHEKRGNFKGAVFIIVLTIISFIYQGLGRAYIFDPYMQGTNFISEIFSVLTPYFLWSLANWCLTTLFDGEGKFKDILLATAYAMLPLPLMIIPATLLTNIVTIDESSIINLLISFGYIWLGFLLFFGMMVTHDYSLFKNVLTVIGTLIGMAFIMFIGILFSGLVSKVFSFVYQIFVEISLRA